MRIEINQNSDCFGEIEALKELMKQNKGFIYKDFTAREIVEIAVGELYDRLVAEKRTGENQRTLR